jgi:S-formylglutathione hydrolase FrmB
MRLTAFGVAMGMAAAATLQAADRVSPRLQHARPLATDSLWSQSLGVWKHYVVWLPPSYDREPERRYPVAYYLHGAWGKETDWTQHGRLHLTLDSLARGGSTEMIVVMPDGDDGWYTTWNWLGDYAGCQRNRPGNAEPAKTYCVPWLKYDDYVARDLVAHVDSAYRTLADRRHRGIAGLSMGGYGAVMLALTYPETFSAAASHSGVLAPLAQARAPGTAGPATLSDSLRAGYGAPLYALMEPAFGKDRVAWTSRDPVHRAERLMRRDRTLAPALFVDCGTGDPFLDQNRAFRRGMERLNLPLQYAEWAGAHNWDYWRRHSAESVRWLADRIAMRQVTLPPPRPG